MICVRQFWNLDAPFDVSCKMKKKTNNNDGVYSIFCVVFTDCCRSCADIWLRIKLFYHFVYFMFMFQVRKKKVFLNWFSEETKWVFCAWNESHVEAIDSCLCPILRGCSSKVLWSAFKPNACHFTVGTMALLKVRYLFCCLKLPRVKIHELW